MSEATFESGGNTPVEIDMTAALSLGGSITAVGAVILGFFTNRVTAVKSDLKTTATELRQEIAATKHDLQAVIDTHDRRTTQRFAQLDSEISARDRNAASFREKVLSRLGETPTREEMREMLGDVKTDIRVMLSSGGTHT